MHSIKFSLTTTPIVRSIADREADNCVITSLHSLSSSIMRMIPLICPSIRFSRLFVFFLFYNHFCMNLIKFYLIIGVIYQFFGTIIQNPGILSFILTLNMIISLFLKLACNLQLINVTIKREELK